MKKALKNPLVAKNISVMSTFLWLWFLVSVVFMGFALKNMVVDSLYKGRFEAGVTQGYVSAISELMQKASEGCNPLTVGDQTDPTKAIQLINVACLQQVNTEQPETEAASPETAE